MQYKVTMWKSNEYCRVCRDCKDECSFPLDIEADSKYKAAEKALGGFLAKRLNTDRRPVIYEIKEVDKK